MERGPAYRQAGDADFYDLRGLKNVMVEIGNVRLVRKKEA
jgi:hypothetical protein